LRYDGSPAAVKCASVSRWACRKRRRKNSPCMRLDVLMLIGDPNLSSLFFWKTNSEFRIPSVPQVLQLKFLAETSNEDAVKS
jgi:hypothetical protein